MWSIEGSHNLCTCITKSSSSLVQVFKNTCALLCKAQCVVVACMLLYSLAHMISAHWQSCNLQVHKLCTNIECSIAKEWDGVKPRPGAPCLPPSVVRRERLMLGSVWNVEKCSLGFAALCKAFPEASDHEMRVCRRQTQTSQVPISFASLVPLVQTSLIF